MLTISWREKPGFLVHISDSKAATVGDNLKGGRKTKR
jgi:hypothetical protein